MSELFIDPSPYNSDTEDKATNSNILNIAMFETQPFSSCIDMSKPVYVYYGSGKERIRARETGSNIIWISAEEHGAFKDCLRISKEFVCIVDPASPTFRSLL